MGSSRDREEFDCPVIGNAVLARQSTRIPRSTASVWSIQQSQGIVVNGEWADALTRRTLALPGVDALMTTPLPLLPSVTAPRVGLVFIMVTGLSLSGSWTWMSCTEPAATYDSGVTVELEKSRRVPPSVPSGF